MYRFTIANQAGTELRLRARKTATIVLRAPNGLTSGVITRFTGTEWASLATDNAGLPDLFAANSAELGAFAVTTSSAARSPAESGSPGAQVSPGASEAVGPAPSVPAGGPSAPIWIAIGLLAVALLLGIWYLRDVARGPSPSGRR